MVSTTVLRRPLKLLQVLSSSATSGAERHAVNLAVLFKQRGHDVQAICPTDGWMIGELKSAGVPTLHFDMKRRFGLEAHASMLRFLRANRFDVIHAHLSRATYISFFSGNLLGIPVVSTVHVETREPLYRFFARRNNRIVAVSNFVRGVLHGRGVPDEYIDVVHNGTDFMHVEYEPTVAVHREFSIPSDRILVGLVARVAKEKGHMVAMEALPEVLKHQPKTHLMFVGRTEGEFPAHLRKRAEELGVEDNVTFTGNRQDIARMFDAMSFSILPSVMEACPLVALESMARGKTMVASRVGGLSEIVVHRETGLLVDQNSEELAEGMCYMLSNHDERERMAANGRILVNERFSNENMLERLERIYYRASGVV